MKFLGLRLFLAASVVSIASISMIRSTTPVELSRLALGQLRNASQWLLLDGGLDVLDAQNEQTLVIDKPEQLDAMTDDQELKEFIREKFSDGLKIIYVGKDDIRVHLIYDHRLYLDSNLETEPISLNGLPIRIPNYTPYCGNAPDGWDLLLDTFF